MPIITRAERLDSSRGCRLLTHWNTTHGMDEEEPEIGAVLAETQKGFSVCSISLRNYERRFSAVVDVEMTGNCR